jgi:hypothetical protein
LSVVFFTDRDLGKQFPSILAAAGLNIRSHFDLFAPDTADVAKNGWVAITRDKRIRYKPNELAAVVQHKAALLVVVGEAPHAVLAANLVAIKEKILRFIAVEEPPFIAKVYRASPAEMKRNPNATGRIEKWFP